jgi:hypothetical protein
MDGHLQESKNDTSENGFPFKISSKQLVSNSMYQTLIKIRKQIMRYGKISLILWM